MGTRQHDTVPEVLSQKFGLAVFINTPLQYPGSSALWIDRVCVKPLIPAWADCRE